MIDLTSLDPATRRDLFQATSQRMKLDAAFIEKDFWICWTLEYLFGQSLILNRIAFKGGTSLSKGYGLISRMSELFRQRNNSDYSALSVIPLFWRAAV